MRSLFKSTILLLLIYGASLNAQDSVKAGKLTFGGYGELVFQNFNYSSDFNRYTYPEKFKSSENRGITDIPHLVFYVAYDFGSGWNFSAEVEFEHGGTASELELEAEEFGEYEQEIEKGGEIILEQFWLEKNFAKYFNLRLGHMVVPVGGSNNRHFPTEYFTLLRPEGESTILPLTWHETGIEVWGKYSGFRYELQLINGLDAEGFGSSNWIQGGSVSPYEFKIATNWAAAFRLDNESIKGLRLSASGYYGLSAANSTKYDRYKNLDGAVTIGSFDAAYKQNNLIVRANAVYGNLSDSKAITSINKSLPKLSPSPHTDIASNACCYGIEAGYNILSFFDKEELLYPFARYEYYNSMEKTENGIVANSRYKRNVATFGLNYFPVKQVVIKGEFSSRFFTAPYNTENTMSLGIMYTGLFN